MGDKTGLRRDLESVVPEGWQAVALYHGAVTCGFGGDVVEAEFTLRYDVSEGRTIDLDALEGWLEDMPWGVVSPEDTALRIAVHVAKACGGWVKVVLRAGPRFQVEVARKQG
jgi:hypothetical protein